MEKEEGIVITTIKEKVFFIHGAINSLDEESQKFILECKSRIERNGDLAFFTTAQNKYISSLLYQVAKEKGVKIYRRESALDRMRAKKNKLRNRRGG